jgi:hypothetical protein
MFFKRDASVSSGQSSIIFPGALPEQTFTRILPAIFSLAWDLLEEAQFNANGVLGYAG